MYRNLYPRAEGHSFSFVLQCIRKHCDLFLLHRRHIILLIGLSSNFARFLIRTNAADVLCFSWLSDTANGSHPFRNRGGLKRMIRNSVFCMHMSQTIYFHVASCVFQEGDWSARWASIRSLVHRLARTLQMLFLGLGFLWQIHLLLFNMSPLVLIGQVAKRKYVSR